MLSGASFIRPKAATIVLDRPSPLHKPTNKPFHTTQSSKVPKQGMMHHKEQNSLEANSAKSSRRLRKNQPSPLLSYSWDLVRPKVAVTYSTQHGRPKFLSNGRLVT